MRVLDIVVVAVVVIVVVLFLLNNVYMMHILLLSPPPQLRTNPRTVSAIQVCLRRMALIDNGMLVVVVLLCAFIWTMM